jgi:putative ABC transport system ATP-binding protein
MKTVIKTEGVEKTYHETEVPVHALRGVDLNIEEGEFSAIVGPSGSGKSTLLNMIGGLDSPSKGRVWVDEEEITEFKPEELVDFRKDKIGFIFQAYNLIPVLTAYENAEFVMLLQNKSKEERKQRVTDLMHRVGLDGKENSRPNQLSGGQQQRVAVVRALAPTPKFILADEPTANLDSKSSENLLDIMAELNEKEGVTFVFSTHDERVIKRARRVITLVDGKIEKDEDRS